MNTLHMISVPEARAIISEKCERLPPVNLPIGAAGGLALAESVIAPIDIPAYPQAGMDGYAFRFAAGQSNLQRTGEMAAGSSHPVQLPPGFATRIFTGAPVPPDADTVIMQEKARVVNSTLHLQDEMLQAGTNVRPAGSEIKAGAPALAAGALLTPPAIGFLAGIGISRVQVYPLPRVSIIVTGNELCPPGTPLPYGQVYEANSYALLAALSRQGIQPQGCYTATDHLHELTQRLEQALAESDVVLITGGVSVGAYDYTPAALDGCGVQQVFHKVKQKPGKPLLLGMLGAKLVFGLPGNPASVLTCFYQYVLPALSHLSGVNRCLPERQAVLSAPFQKAGGLTHFLKVHYNGSQINLLSGQESYKLNSFAMANGLAEIPAEVTTLAAGDTVKVHLF